MKVRADLKAAKREFSKLEKKAIPRAARNALNDTAFDVRMFVVRTLYPRSFPNRRNPRFPSVAFRVSRRARIGKLESRVEDVLNRYFLPMHIRGGVKIPRGRYRAVPTRNVQRTQRGVAAKHKPDRLPGAFVADLTGRGPAIWTRGKATRAGVGKLKLWYVLEPSTEVRQVFPFFRLGYAKGRQRWPRHFEREVKRALSKMRG